MPDNKVALPKLDSAAGVYFSKECEVYSYEEKDSNINCRKISPVQQNDFLELYEVGNSEYPQRYVIAKDKKGNRQLLPEEITPLRWRDFAFKFMNEDFAFSGISTARNAYDSNDYDWKIIVKNPKGQYEDKTPEFAHYNICRFTIDSVAFVNNRLQTIIKNNHNSTCDWIVGYYEKVDGEYKKKSGFYDKTTVQKKTAQEASVEWKPVANLDNENAVELNRLLNFKSKER